MNLHVSVNLSNIRFLGPHLVPFWSPFLLPKVPFWSPFHSKSGPLLVPILTNLGPLSMWEQCITDDNVKNWIGVKLGRWACSSWSGIGSLFCSAGGDSKRFWGNIYWARWTRQELPRPPTWQQSFQSQVFQKNWFEEPPNPNLGQAHLPCWAAQLQQPDGHAWGGS